MAQELPRGYTGQWHSLDTLGYPAGRWEWAFNQTIPTPHGTAPNDVFCWLWPPRLDVEMWKLWTKTSPLVDVVRGCRSQCEAQIRAPAVFATSCITREIPVTYVEQYDLRSLIADETAPPLETMQLLVATNLVVHGDQEKIAVTTGWTRVEESASRPRDCNTTLTLDTCFLEAGIGEFDVVIEGNEIDMTTLGTPRLVALSNNTDVDHGFDKVTGYHPSTLGGVVAMMLASWDTFVSSYKVPGRPPVEEESSTMVVELYQNKGAVCQSFRNPRSDYMASLNKLMVYFGSLAGRNIVNNAEALDSTGVGQMDPDTPAVTTVEGYPFGKQDVFRTHYGFFVAAAVVELVCILLVAPT